MVSPVQRRAPKRRIGATRLGQCVNNSFTDDRRFFMTTKPDRSRYSTGRLATIADMSSPALCTASGPKSAGEGERVAVIALHHISGDTTGGQPAGHLADQSAAGESYCHRRPESTFSGHRQSGPRTSYCTARHDRIASGPNGVAIIKARCEFPALFPHVDIRKERHLSHAAAGARTATNCLS